MKLVIRNVSTLVQTDSHHETRWLDELLSVPVEKAQYMRRNPKLWNWDGMKRFFIRERFPSGLVPLVYRQAQEDGISIELKDERFNDPLAYQIAHDRPLQFLKTPWQMFSLVQRAGITQTPQILRCLYQYSAVRKLLNYSFRGIPWPRGVLEMATGSGKTFCAAMLVRAIGQPTLYIVPTLGLLHQTSEVLEKLMPHARRPIGIVGEGQRDFQNITVATIQTCTILLKNPEFLKYLQSISCIIIDECHAITGKDHASFDSLMRNCPAYWRIGFSATPLRRRDAGDVALIGHIGDVVYTLKAADLIKRGLLASVQVKMLQVTTPDCRGMKFPTAYKESVTDSAYLHELTVRLVKGFVENQQAVLVMTTRKSHGHQLVDMLTHLHRVHARYVDGETPASERTEVNQQVEDGRLLVVVSTTVYDIGIDIPSIRGLILLGGGYSEIKTLQRPGRGMRYKAQDNSILIYDFYYLNNKFLERHSKERLRIYQEAGLPVDIVQVD